MNKKGYVTTGFTFLIFVSALILAICYSQLATDKEDDIYHKINADTLYYIAKNIDTLHEELTDCSSLMGNITEDTYDGKDLGVKIEYVCDDITSTYYTKITRDNQSIYIDLTY